MNTKCFIFNTKYTLKIYSIRAKNNNWKVLQLVVAELFSSSLRAIV